MELALAVVALVVAGIALGLAMSVRSTIGVAAEQARDALAAVRREAEQAKRAAENADRATGELRAEAQQLRDELRQIRATLDTPPPPLPRARPGNLEDLRERLRAEQQDSGEEDDGSA